MEGQLRGKKVLVAGAGGLLGSKLVHGLVSQGAAVVAADIAPEQVKSRLEGHGADFNNIVLVKLDVTDENDVKSFFSHCGELSGAVNATYPRNKSYGASFYDVSLDSFNENVSLHLGSAFLFSQQCAAYFEEHQTSFSLVNISSIYGVIAPKFEIYDGTSMTMPVEYAAIKSALLHLNKYIVSFVNNTHFRINCVSPGGVFDHQPESFLQAYKAQTNGAGMLEVSEMIGSVMFLLSDQSRFVTGQNIIVDDGFSI